MSGYSGHRMSPWWWWPDGTHVYLAEGIRKSIRQEGSETPVIIAGKLETRSMLKNTGAGEGGYDRIMPRSLADPDWPVKAQRGEKKRSSGVWPAIGVSKRTRDMSK